MATAGLALGLIALACAHQGKQLKFGGPRTALLWQVAERVEQQAPKDCCIVWRGRSGPAERRRGHSPPLAPATSRPGQHRDPPRGHERPGRATRRDQADRPPCPAGGRSARRRPPGGMKKNYASRSGLACAVTRAICTGWRLPMMRCLHASPPTSERAQPPSLERLHDGVPGEQVPGTSAPGAVRGEPVVGGLQSHFVIALIGPAPRGAGTKAMIMRAGVRSTLEILGHLDGTTTIAIDQVPGRRHIEIESALQRRQCPVGERLPVPSGATVQRQVARLGSDAAIPSWQRSRR